MLKQDEYREGEVLSASKLDALAREVARLGKITAIPPVVLYDEAAGISIGCGLGATLIGPGVTTSASSAASGTTPNIVPGTVNVTLSTFDGTHLATTGTALTGVLSNYTTIIPTAKPCWVYLWSGSYFILVADC